MRHWQASVNHMGVTYLQRSRFRTQRSIFPSKLIGLAEGESKRAGEGAPSKVTKVQWVVGRGLPADGSGWVREQHARLTSNDLVTEEYNEQFKKLEHGCASSPHEG